MATENKKISQLDILETSSADDLVLVVDIETDTTRNQRKVDFLKEIYTALGTKLNANDAFSKNYDDLENKPDLSVFDNVGTYSTFNSLPNIGTNDKFYLTTDTNRIYRWSGSQYVNISADLTNYYNKTETDNLLTEVSSQWETATGGINYAGGNVGIGTATPDAALHVVGNITSPGADSGTSEKFGSQASAAGNYAVAIGYQASAASSGTAIGAGAVTNNATVAVGRRAIANSAATVALGNGAEAISTGATAIGTGAEALGTNAFAFGRGAISSHSGSMVFGRAATSTASNQLVIGSGSVSGYHISDIYIGSGVTNTNPQDVTINGSGAEGEDVAGGDISIVGGRATGNALGGSILFQTSDAGSSGETLQSVTTKMAIDANGNVGIGTTAPSEKLHVAGNGLLSGDIELTNVTKGVILTDRTTAVRKRLFINNGVVGIETV